MARLYLNSHHMIPPHTQSEYAVDKMYMGSTWGSASEQVYYGTYSIPANLLSIPSIPLSSNCIVVIDKRFAHAH